MHPLDRFLLLGDRTLVLFIGMAVGATIAASFIGGAGHSDRAEANGPSAPVIATPSQPVRDPLTPRLSEALAQRRKIRIGVFGDSFGEGIWSGLYHQLRGDERFEVIELAERSTGFTRYRSLDLLEDTRSKLDREPIDIAILSFGANDTQGIYLDGRGHNYMSESWQRIVSERAAAIVALLRSRGVTVYWVGLPKMRDPAFDADISRMNQFYAARMQALGVPYIETLPQTVDAEGNYMPYLPARRGGERRAARVNDGIHMTIPGYIHVMEGLSERIRRTIDGPERQTGRAPAPSESAKGG